MHAELTSFRNLVYAIVTIETIFAVSTESVMSSYRSLTSTAVSTRGNVFIF